LAAPVNAAARSAASDAATIAPADATATRTYLEAVYQLEHAAVNDVPAVSAAETSFVTRLGNECGGVLAGEPKDELRIRLAHPETPRAKGERERTELQAETINQELSAALESVHDQQERAAVEVYGAAVAPLTWTNPRIAPLVEFDANALRELLAPGLASVCADTRAWAQSGYHVLSSASREFASAVKASSERPRATGSVGTLLKPYEDARDRQLIAETKALHSRLVPAAVASARLFSGLQRALGLPESSFEEQQQEPVLAHGATRAGSTFVVRRETQHESLAGRCADPVSVQFTERREGSDGSSGYGGSVCLSNGSDARASITCGGGVESLTASVSPSVRTVRLQLSNGRLLSSRVLRVAHKSGVRGIYVEAIRGYSPYPVSLVELDRHGRTVMVQRLVNARCMPQSSPIGPTFVSLVNGTAPGGEPFTIEGTLVHFGDRQTSFSVSAGGRLHENDESGIQLGGNAKAFQWSLGGECPPSEFVVIDGILSAPGDSVLARTPSGVVPLVKLALAPDLHSKGPLVYGVFATTPSELIIRRSDGSTLYTESLVIRAHE
jgi:hypothetical protein